MQAPPRREIVWSTRSREDLKRIGDYIARFAPLASRRFTGRLVAAVESLSAQPDRGRPVTRHIRELVVIAPYLIRYRVTASKVQVIRIRPGAQRPD